MVILHKAKRSDNYEEIKGFLTKRWGQYHIASELDESIVYPVIEESIEPCMGNVKSAKIDEIWKSRHKDDKNLIFNIQNWITGESRLGSLETKKAMLLSGLWVAVRYGAIDKVEMRDIYSDFMRESISN